MIKKWVYFCGGAGGGDGGGGGGGDGGGALLGSAFAWFLAQTWIPVIFIALTKSRSFFALFTVHNQNQSRID